MNFKKLLVCGLVLASGLCNLQTAYAVTICAGSYSCDAPNYYLPPIVVNPSPPIVQSGALFLNWIPFQNQDGWNYSFLGGAVNLSFAEVSYFGGWPASSATVPDGWTFEIVPQSGVTASTALWKNQYPLYNGGLIGASFSSAYAPTDALMKMTMNDGTFEELHLYLPLTPSAETSGYLLATLPVPEPSGLVLGLAGLGLVVLVLRKRKAIQYFLFSPLI